MKVITEFSDGTEMRSGEDWKRTGDLTFKQYVEIIQEDGGMYISDADIFYPYHSIVSIRLE